MAKDKEIKRGDTATPSEQGTSPIEVALTGTMLGPTATSIEEIIVNSFATVIYGSTVVGNKKSLRDLQSVAGNGKTPMDVFKGIRNTLTKGILKEIEKTNKLITSQTQSTNLLIKSIAETIALLPAALTDMAQKITKGISASSGGGPVVVQLLLESGDVNEMLENLITLSNDEKLASLSEAFKLLGEQAKPLKELNDSTEPFIKTLSNFFAQHEQIKNASDALNDLLKNSKNFDNLKNINIENLSKAANDLVALSSSNIDSNKIQLFCDSYKELINSVSNIDVVSIDLESLSKITEIKNKLEEIEEASFNVTMFTDAIEKLNESISSIKNIDLSLLENLSSGLEKFSESKFNVDNVIAATDAYETIASAIDNTNSLDLDIDKIAVLSELNNELQNLSEIETLDLSSLSSLIKNIDDINVFSENLKAKLDEFNGKNIDLSNLAKLSKDLSNIANVKLDTTNIDSLKASIVAISNLLSEASSQNFDTAQLDGLTKVLISLDDIAKFEIPSFSNIETYTNNIPLIQNLIDKFNSLTNVDSDNLLNIEMFFEELGKVNYNNVSPLPKDFDKTIKSLISSGIPNISKFISELNASEITKFDNIKMHTLYSVLNDLALLKLEDGKSFNLGFEQEDLKKFVENISATSKYLLEIQEKINEASNIDLSKIVSFKTLVNAIQEIEFKGNNDINLTDLIKLNDSIESIKNVIMQINDKLGDYDFNVIEEKTKLVNSVLLNLSSLSYERKNALNNDELVQLINDNVFENIGILFGQLSKSSKDINQNNLDLIDVLGNSLKKLENISFEKKNDIDINGIESLKISIDKISSILGEISTNISSQNLNTDQLDNLTEVLFSLDDISKFPIADFSNVESYSNALPSIKTLIDEFNKLTSVDTDKLTNFELFFDNFGKVNYGNITPLPKNFDKTIDSLITSGIPNISRFIDKLNASNINTFDDLKLHALYGAINDLAQIKLEDGKSFDLGFNPKELKKFIKNIDKTVEYINEIQQKIEGYNDFDTSKIVSLKNSLDAIQEIQFKGGNKINIKELTKLDNSMDYIKNVIVQINDKLGNYDFLEVKEKTKSMNSALMNLSMLGYEPKNEIDVDSLKELIDDNVFENVGKLLEQLTKSLKNIKPNTAELISVLNNSLINLENISYQKKNDIDVKGINELNTIAPDLTKLFNELSRPKDLSKTLKNVMKISSIFKVLEKINTEKLENKNFTGIKDIIIAINDIAWILNYFDDTCIDKLPTYKDFVEQLITDKDSVLKTTLDKLDKLDMSDELKDKVKAISKFLESIADVAEMVAMIGYLGAAASEGINVIKTFINDAVDLLNTINGMDQKAIQNAQELINGIGKLILYSAVAMIIGGAFIVFFPKLVIGALAFGLVLGAFLYLTLTAIKWAANGMKEGIQNAKDLGKLILICAGVMIIGGLFITAFPKLVIGALAFGLVLGLFLFTTLTAIKWAANGMKDTMKDIKGIVLLIVASAGIMIIGGLFMTLYPKLIFGAFAFTVTLGAFIFAVLKAIKWGSKGIDKTMKNVSEIVVLVGACALIMLVGGLIMTLYPQIIAGAFLFTVTLGAFIFATLKAINFGTKGIEKTMTKASEFAILIGVCAGVLIVGGGLFTLWPELVGGTILFGTIFTAFVFAMSFALKQLSKNEGDLIKGAAAMAIIAGVVLIASTSMLILRHAVEGAALDLLAGVAIMSGALLAVAAMSIGMGALASNPFFWIGIAAMGAVSGIVLLASAAMLTIALAMETFKKVGKFDISPVLANIKGITSLVGPLGAFGILSPIIIAASVAIVALSGAIGKISETVKDVASLKIPIYEGTKKVGYRQLTNEDFKSAAENTKEIVTTLGGAIIDIYKKAPYMFDDPLIGENKFSIVCKSTTKLAQLISSIAYSVKSMGMLLIPDKWDKNGNAIHFKKMTDAEIVQAGENTKTIVSTLSLALIDLYNNNKEIYEDKSIFSFMGEKPGNTPLARVVAVSNKVVGLISKTANAVKSMGMLLIPDKWDKNGNAIHFKKMTDAEIVQAGENTKTIVSTLSLALIDLYNNNKEIYEDKSIFSFMGEKPGNTPLARVVAVSNKVVGLISKTANSVKSMGMLLIPDKWDKNGNAIHYSQMKSAEIVQAGENTKEIINTLSLALIDLYNNNKEMYTDDSLFGSIFGEKPGNTPLAKVVSVSERVIKLISKTASGVKAIGTLMLPTEWNKDGKPIKFEKMKDSEILAAGTNTSSIITTISNELIKLYNDNKEMFEDKSLFSFLGEKPGNTPLAKVISVSSKLVDLIAKTGESVINIAKLQIPTEWNKDGKAIKFRNMNDADFKLAQDNVGKVITTIAGELMVLYTDHNDWFEDGGNFLSKKDSPFAKVMNTSLNLVKIISAVSESIKDIASLQIPDKWNEQGKAIAFRTLTDADFSLAKDNIGQIVKTIGEEIMTLYKDHNDWFEDGGNFLSKKDSPFVKVMTSCNSMSQMISNIAESIGNMAQLQIPDGWDENGKPIKFRGLEEGDFKLAQDNIGKIVKAIGEEIMIMYDQHNEWFEDGSTLLMKKETPFAKVMNSCVAMGDMIASISSAIANMAKLQIPEEWNEEGKPVKFRAMRDGDFTLAQENIGKVVKAIGEEIMVMYDQHNEWFEDGGNWLTGHTPCPFSKVLESTVSMGEMLSSISSGIANMAQLQIPTKWDEKGSPIEFRSMGPQDFSLAKDNVGEVVTCIGDKLIAMYDGDTRGMFRSQEDEETPFNKVAQGCAYMGDIVKGIAEGVAEMATLEETLKKQGINVDKGTYKNAADKIGEVLTVIGNALMTTFTGHKDWFQNPPIVIEKKGWFSSSKEVKPDNSDTPFQKIVKASALMGGMIISIAEGISFFATVTQTPIPDGNGGTFKLDIPAATKNIGDIICTIGRALVKTAGSANFVTFNRIEPIIQNVQKSADAVLAVANLLEKIGTGEIPVTDKEGNILYTIPISNETITKAANVIGNVINGVSAGFENASKFGSKFEFSIFGGDATTTRIRKMLELVNYAIEVVGINLRTLARIGAGELNLWDKDFTKIVETVKFTDNDLTKGATAIRNIIKNVAKGVADGFDSFDDWDIWCDLRHASNIGDSRLYKMLQLVDYAMKVVGWNVNTLRKIGQGTINYWDKDYTKIVETVTFTQNDLKLGAQTIGEIVKTISKALSDSAKSCLYYLGGDDWEKTTIYKTLMAVDEAKNTVGKMTLFLSHLANNEYTYFDTRFNVLKTIAFGSQDKLRNAATTIGQIVNNIAKEVANASDESYKLGFYGDFKKSGLYKTLVAVISAKDVVGKMTLFLSHLANNEYTYYDLRKKKEESISFGSLDNLIAAASAIGSIVKTIASSIGEGADSASKSLSGGIFSGDFKDTKAYKSLVAVSCAKDAVGPLAVFLALLANGKFTYKNSKGEEKSINFDLNGMINASYAIGTIITSIAESISKASDSINGMGFNIFGNSKDSKIDRTFVVLNKSIAMLSDLATVVSYYANGEIAQVSIVNGETKITKTGAPNVDVAKQNINTIIGGLVNILTTTTEKLDKISDIDKTMKTLDSALRIIDKSIYSVQQIAKIKSDVESLSGFAFGTIMTPILTDMDALVAKMNTLGSAKGSFNIKNLIGGTESLTPFRGFIKDVNSMIAQSLLISASPVEQAYNTMNSAIKSTMETMATVQMPESFGQQVEDLNKFIKVVNTIRIDGVDSLTQLLKELNKMGINMGNLDKLTNAISNKLTVTLKECNKIMKDLKKTMDDDAKRKEKHKKEIKSSVSEIQKIFNNSMKVIVKMDEGQQGKLGGGDIDDEDKVKGNNPPAHR